MLRLPLEFGEFSVIKYSHIEGRVVKKHVFCVHFNKKCLGKGFSTGGKITKAVNFLNRYLKQ